MRFVLKNLFKGKIPKVNFFKEIFLQTSYFSLSKKIFRSIDEFKPDIIYLWISDSFWCDSVLKISKKLEIPYVIHFMDNHLESKFEDTFDEHIQNRFKSKAENLIKNANLIYTISETMADEYSKKWDCECKVFRGSLDFEEWANLRCRDIKDKNINITYVGSIEKYQIDALEDVTLAIQELNNTKQVNLNLYVNKREKLILKQKYSNNHFIKIYDHPQFIDLREILKNSSILISFYSFDNEAINYYKYSFATKIVPYMASGTPILIYGPKGINPVEYSRKGEWAEIVDSNNIQIIKSSILKLLTNQNHSEDLISKAFQVAKTDHDMKNNSDRFLRSLEASKFK